MNGQPEPNFAAPGPAADAPAASLDAPAAGADAPGPEADHRRRRHGPPWGGGGRGHRRWGTFFGCLVIALVLFVGLVTALASWVAGTVLGIVSPGTAASGPGALPVLVVVVLAVVVVVRIVGGAVRPLAAIADAAERLADGDAGVRVTVRGPGAVRRLAGSFNAMAERIDRSRADRQALLADVTHELRTPLQVIGGSVEAMLDGVHPRDDAHLAPLLAETAVMGRLLEDLRTLSLAEAGALPLHREEVDVRRLLADVAAGHAAAAREAGVDLVAHGGPPIVLDVDPVRIREVVTNLVTNAVRHTPSGGSVRLRGRVDGAWVELSVTDTGEGITPEELDRVFERFHRRPVGNRSATAPVVTPTDGGGPPDESTPPASRRADSGGSGLGLAIARDLVAAHGGTVHAESEGIPGRGTTFRVRLPRRD